jgi:outer membrane lipoprotein carrier protein
MTNASPCKPLNSRTAWLHAVRLCSACWLAVILVAASSAAWAVQLDDVIHTLETPFQGAVGSATGISDYSADFSQLARIASLDRSQQASGRIEVAFTEQAGPGGRTVKFRWLYLQPTSQEIVSDGVTLWVYVPENRQVIQSDIAATREVSQTDPMVFLTGLGNLSRDFVIDWATPDRDDEGNFALELTPRKPSPMISRLVMVVNRLAVEAYLQDSRQNNRGELYFPITSTTVYDPNGNSTVITFSNLQLNKGIPPENFSFKVPEGVQVIRPTDSSGMK